MSNFNFLNTNIYLFQILGNFVEGGSIPSENLQELRKILNDEKTKQLSTLFISEKQYDDIIKYFCRDVSDTLTELSLNNISSTPLEIGKTYYYPLSYGVKGQGGHAISFLFQN